MGPKIGRKKTPSNARRRRVAVRRRLLVERLDQRRVLAAITGTVFEDINLSLQRDAADADAPQRLVYIDANGNAGLDAGESFVVAGEDGSFRFDNLDDGSYLLRLFNGTQTQRQTTPIEATLEGGTVSVSDGVQLGLNGSSLVLTADSVVVGDLDSGDGTTVSVGNQLTRMETLPDGTLLIVGTDTSGDTSWIVDPADGTVTPVDLSDSVLPVAWSDVAIDSSGQGVLLEQSLALGVVRSIDASDPEAGIQVTTTTSFVPADTQVLASDSGNRSVFGWSGNDGLQLSLWSNSTASFIHENPIDVSGTTQLLAFDDASGLLALRTAGGGVSVHDVDADFATLHTIADATGPVAIDGARDLLMTISPVDAMLKLINLSNGTLIANLAIDLSSIGQVAALAVGNSKDSIVVLGAAGVTEVALRKAAAHEVTITDGEDADPILFGVALDGSNAAPAYTTLPDLQTSEDSTLNLAAPGARAGSSDADGDSYVLIQRSEAENGTAIFQVDGSLSYVPNDDFSGVDNVNVLLHDGRVPAEEVTLEISVTPLPDPPTNIVIQIDPVPEDVLPGTAVGTIEVIDVDGPNHRITIDDPRFGEQNGVIIFIGGNIDFEDEPLIPITVSASDNETGDTIEENASVSVRDANDPITAITPTNAFVFENAPGDVVTELFVHDQDEEQIHTFTVDDDRFTVEGRDLRLKRGVAVDYEAEQEIVVNVTATEVPDGGTFTQAITIMVRDLPEQPQSIGLTNFTVMELVAGAVVGDVTLDNAPAPSRFDLTVDDSRFEIDGTTLKLREDVFVERAAQEEIQLSITAEDSLGTFTTVTDTFVIEVLENETPFHNHNNPYDVDHGGDVSAVDALAIINYLNAFGPGPVEPGTSAQCLDVNADGLVTALDALLVLNEMTRQRNRGGGVDGGEQEPDGPGEGEGELIAGAPSVGAQPEGEDARGQSLTPVGNSSLESTSKLVDASIVDEHVGGQVEIPAHETSREFAENVDETLRLLSEKTS